ncbi:cystathionine beta-synthase [Gryllotalpicola protaetiae]|uniref:Cystathionine beta-synthase n=1 Tax=Gryllotalpicola protaetiae TaxID=2419771 RepID=A0A387BNL5_9MICO|nr:cystathionine beta-synthase [Gryllotalpicola protaetiae]AYG04032.1 cystathionine beta-synthase [Gryllotalpicola protaetiae]
MRIANHIVDLIGDTPLVRLTKVTAGIPATVLAKVEYFNPGGSAKDRIAERIIDAAERDGLLKPGGTIVEPTSGNTGVGLALVAQQRGYRCVFVLPDKVGEDKRAVLTAYGAEVVVTPTSVAADDPDSYYSVSDRLAAEIPGAFKPNQYANPNGPRSHYESTGPEIWRDTDGTVTHFVAGIGTGGTITGTGRYLKEISDGRVRIIGADPVGSVYSGGTGRPYLVEGVGEDIWPPAYDPSVPDEVIAVSDREAFEMTRRLAREEALLVGGSSGMAVVAALRVAATLGPDDTVVVLLPDGGRGYLGKIFNDGWLRSYGFSEPAAEHTVRDVIASKSGELPALVHAHPHDTVHDAIEIMGTYGVSQLPVLSAEPPVVLGEVVGALDEATLLEQVFTGEAALGDEVAKVVQAPLPLIGISESVAAAQERLAEASALLITDGGAPVTVLTRADLLTFLSK